MPLSEEERRFREELRKFVLSNVTDLNNRFGYFTGGVVNGAMDDANNRRIPKEDGDRLEHLVQLYQAAVRSLNASYPPLVASANKSLDELNEGEIGSKLKAYFTDYRELALTFWHFLAVSRLSVKNQDLLEQWQRSDERAWESYLSLKAFPAKTETVDKWINEGFFEARTGWMKERLRNLEAGREK